MTERTIDAGKAYAGLLLRLGLGIIFAFYGLQKIFKYSAVIQQFLNDFQGKFQPFFLVQIVIYIIPFIEIIGGLLLITGYKHRLILFIMGLYVIILTVGLQIQMDTASVARNLIYLVGLTFCLHNSSNDIFRAGA
jgi:uncharacterized membrane protein YphA (DoxX/SURF4 family)